MRVWTIVIAPAVYELMSSCSKEEYKSADRPDKCDYQPANCTFENVTRGCDIRRKGSASWRDMGDKPPYKIKMDEPVEFAPNWNTTKVTLNNGVQQTYSTAEVDAYNVFRGLGVPTPEAERVSVTIGAQTHEYTMIETISDDAFMNKHFGDTWILWEMDANQLEYKRDSGEFGSALLPSLTLEHVNQTAMIHYYVGELRTDHWDGACLRERSNNHYIAYDGSVYTYIPSGVDQTFNCVKDTYPPYCAPMVECFDTPACKEQVDHHSPEVCGYFSPWIIVGIGVGVSCVLFILYII